MLTNQQPQTADLPTPNMSGLGADTSANVAVGGDTQPTAAEGVAAGMEHVPVYSPPPGAAGAAAAAEVETAAAGIMVPSPDRTLSAALLPRQTSGDCTCLPHIAAEAGMSLAVRAALCEMIDCDPVTADLVPLKVFGRIKPDQVEHIVQKRIVSPNVEKPTTCVARALCVQDDVR